MLKQTIGFCKIKVDAKQRRQLSSRNERRAKWLLNTVTQVHPFLSESPIKLGMLNRKIMSVDIIVKVNQNK